MLVPVHGDVSAVHRLGLESLSSGGSTVASVLEQLSRAPITEAVLDLRVTPAAQVTLDDLGAVADGFAEYPNRRTMALVQQQVALGTQETPFPTQMYNGYACSSEDGLQIAQVRLDGFSFSRLSPYLGWHDFCSAARKLWRLYKKGVNPSAIPSIWSAVYPPTRPPSDSLGVVSLFAYSAPISSSNHGRPC